MRPRLSVIVRNEMQITSKRQERAITKAVRGTSLWMKQQIVLSFSAPKSGSEQYRRGKLKRRRSGGSADLTAGTATYTRGRRKLHHIASAPGEPPARDTGRLMNSIGYRMASPVVAYVGSFGVNYAAALEFGSKRRGLEPRPYVRPVAKRAQKVLSDLMAKYLDEAST